MPWTDKKKLKALCYLLYNAEPLFEVLPVHTLPSCTPLYVAVLTLPDAERTIYRGSPQDTEKSAKMHVATQAWECFHGTFANQGTRASEILGMPKTDASP